MYNLYHRVLSLWSSNRLVETIRLVAMALVIASIIALLPAQQVQAAGCRYLSIYADYSPQSQHNGQPSVFIWNGNVRPDPSKLTIKFYNASNYLETVPSPSDWGIRTDAPWIERRDGGWYGYYIATRWINGLTPPFYFHQVTWNDDWRWSAYYCG